MEHDEASLLPWQRQPGESEPAYGAFRQFLDTPLGERSSQRVASDLGKNIRLIQRWRAHWDWRERVDAFDREQQRKEIQEQNRLRREMNERHLQIITVAQRKAVERLRDMNPSELSPALLFDYIRETMRLERLIRGEPETVEERREVTETRMDIRQKIEQYAPVLQQMIDQGILSGVPGEESDPQTVDMEEIEAEDQE